MHRLARLLACATVALAALPALAATINVSNGTDNPASPAAGSLRDAIAKAQPGDTIVIAKGVNVQLAGDLEVPAGRNLTIEGPAPNGLKMQASVTQGKPAPNPPAKLVVKGGGTTIRQIAFDGATVVVDGATGVTITSCAFDGKKQGVGVDVKNAKDVSIGNATEVNTFTGCTTAVNSAGSTNVTVTHSNFTKNEKGVVSTDDTNVTVSENSIKDGSGVEIAGSSGTVSTNTITPGKSGGTAVHVGKSPGGGASKGKVTVDANDIKVKGAASGVKVDGRTDVTISANDVKGKTSGPGVSVACDAASVVAEACVVEGNDVAGCTPGIEFACDGAPGAVCTIADNTCAKCPEAGIACDVGAGVACTVTGNTCDACEDGMHLTCDAGGTLTCDGSTVANSKTAGVRAGGTSLIDLSNLALSGSARAFGLYAAPNSIVVLHSAQFTGTGVFAETGSTFAATFPLLDAGSGFIGKLPVFDIAPRGPGTAGLTLEVSDAGILTVQLDHGGIGQVRVTDTNGNHIGDADMSAGTARLDLDGAGFEGGVVVVQVRDASFGLSGGSVARAEGTASWKRPAQPGGAAPFAFSTTKVTVTGPVGQDASEEIEVTNTTGTAQTLDIATLTGNFAAFPRGLVPFAPGEKKTIVILHSSMKAVIEKVNLAVQQVNGAFSKVIKITGISK